MVERETMDKIVVGVLAALIIGVMLFGIVATFKYLRLNIGAPYKIVPRESNDIFCGGIANIQCPQGYYCKLEGKYPDAGGTCVKSSVLNNM